jgi:hypothetical protein
MCRNIWAVKVHNFYFSMKISWQNVRLTRVGMKIQAINTTSKESDISLMVSQRSSRTVSTFIYTYIYCKLIAIIYDVYVSYVSKV